MPCHPPQPLILLVDDEPVNIEILHEILQEDYEILFATHGGEALQVAAAQRPDLILLDVMMPNMDGREVCTRLKSNPDLRAIPVIFVTAMGGEREETIGLEAGAVDYITKPVNPAVVRLRVKNHLELKRNCPGRRPDREGLTWKPSYGSRFPHEPRYDNYLPTA
ncbi:MAG: response regulator [Magnetococcales bacterium]|nr:response regulator [Magnetococcales bacterium]